LTYPTIDELLHKINNRFLLANVIADRAKAITEGSLPYIEDSDVLNPIETAMNELKMGKIGFKILEAPSKKSEKAAEIKDFWAPREMNLEKEDKKKSKKTKTSSKKK
jgi:DNA-directed RNA polymerase omega subunit